MKGIVKVSFLNTLIGLPIEDAKNKIAEIGCNVKCLVKENVVSSIISFDYVEEDEPRKNIPWPYGHWSS